MVAEYITPHNSFLDVPQEYISKIPEQEELNNIKEGDIILVRIKSRLEDSYFTEFCGAVVKELEFGVVTAIVLNSMKLTVNHGLRENSNITIYEDFIFAILTEREYLEVFK